MKGFRKTKIPNLSINVDSGIYHAATKPPGAKFRVYRSLHTLHREVAKLRLPRVLAQIMAAKNRVSGANPTLGTCAAIYLANHRSTARKGQLPKPDAVKYRASTINGIRLLLPGFDSIFVDEFTAARAAAWAKVAMNKSPTWFNGMLQSFRGLMQVAVLGGHLETNPFAGITPMRITMKKRESYSFDEVERLFAELKRRKLAAEKVGRKSHAYFFCRFLYLFSLRLTAAVSLTPAMVDRHNKVFVVPGEFSKGRRAGDLVYPPIFPEMQVLLDEMDAELGADRKFILPIKGCSKVLPAACKACKLPRLNHHGFRHIFTTHALLRRVPVAVLSDWLDHRDGGALLLKRYNHIINSVRMAEAEKLRFLQEPKIVPLAEEKRKSGK